MKKALIYLLTGAILASFLFYKGCDEVKIQEGENAKVFIDFRSGKLDIRKNKRSGSSVGSGKDSTVKIPNLRRAEITVDESGEIVVKPITRGFTREFNAVAYYGSASKLSYGIAYQYAWWGKMGGFVSGTYSPEESRVQLQTSVGDQVTPNTHLLLGYDTNKDITFGVGMRF